MTDGVRVSLHLVRHADAGAPEDWSGPDERRPLSAKGEAQSERLGRFLASTGFAPDAVITSPRLRAVRTAELVAAPLGGEVRIDDRLGGSLDLVALEAIMFDAGEPIRPILVGHDPDVSELVSALVGGEVQMRKGGLAKVEAARPLRPGTGTLRWLVPPDLLGSS